MTPMTDQTVGKEELTEWSGLVAGDEVTLHREQKTLYKFISAVVNPETGECTHVNLIGGKIGRNTKSGSTAQRKFRAVLPDRVKIPSDRELEKQRSIRALREEEQ